MLKKLTLIGISAITFSAIGYAQKNNVYAELGGAGFIPTINYERMLTDNIVARVGWGSGTGEEDHDGHDHGDESKISFIPLGAAYLLGSVNHKLEFGGGMTMISGTFDIGADEEADAKANMTYFGGGYRYQRGTGGFLLGVKGYYLSLAGFSVPWAGLTLGWTF